MNSKVKLAPLPICPEPDYPSRGGRRQPGWKSVAAAVGASAMLCLPACGNNETAPPTEPDQEIVRPAGAAQQVAPPEAVPDAGALADPPGTPPVARPAGVPQQVTPPSNATPDAGAVVHHPGAPPGTRLGGIAAPATPPTAQDAPPTGDGGTKVQQNPQGNDRVIRTAGRPMPPRLGGAPPPPDPPTPTKLPTPPSEPTPPR